MCYAFKGFVLHIAKIMSKTSKRLKRHVSVRLPVEIVDRLDAAVARWAAWAEANSANETAIDRTFVIQVLLTEALDREKKEEDKE
jgi:hypothetical protein